jgi:signal transduction histidine kinase
MHDLVLQLAAVPRRPPRVDVLIAGGLLAWALLEALTVEGPGTPVTKVLVALGFTAPLVFRRRHPVLAVLAITAVVFLRAALSEVAYEGSMPFPCLLVGAFSIALYAHPARLAIAAAPLPALAFVLAVALGDFAGEQSSTDYVIIPFFALGAWTAGWLVRRRAAGLARALAAQPEIARGAVAEERARIARELHDIVAHSISVIAVNAGAAEAQLRVDPDAAERHLAAVRRTAGEALGDMRRLVGVLREEEPVLAPQPGLARVGDLLREARDAGLPVDFEQTGPADPLPPGIDLAAYRIVQEGLTNVRKHAGRVPARVRLHRDAHRLRISVDNDAGARPATDGPPGHGLVGMRERARLYGGEVVAEPTPDGGFCVRATLPLPS